MDYRLFRKKQDADEQAVKVKQLAAEVEQLQAAIAEMSKLKTDKETKLENTMRIGSNLRALDCSRGAFTPRYL